MPEKQVGASQLEDELVSTSEVAATAFGRKPESLEAEHGTHNETDAEEELFYKREILGEVMWNAFMGECDAPIPESLQTAHLGWKQIEQAQAGDKWVKGCVEQLKREKVSEYELIRGVLHRVKKNEDGTCAAARIYLPESLRVIAIRNAHDSIWGGHRSDTATFKDMVMKYYWPKMAPHCAFVPSASRPPLLFSPPKSIALFRLPEVRALTVPIHGHRISGIRWRRHACAPCFEPRRFGITVCTTQPAHPRLPQFQPAFTRKCPSVRSHFSAQRPRRWVHS